MTTIGIKGKGKTRLSMVAFTWRWWWAKVVGSMGVAVYGLLLEASWRWWRSWCFLGETHYHWWCWSWEMEEGSGVSVLVVDRWLVIKGRGWVLVFWLRGFYFYAWWPVWWWVKDDLNEDDGGMYWERAIDHMEG